MSHFEGHFEGVKKVPAIIYRDIISHITITYRDIMYFFKTFKKSTAPYKVHYMGLRYIKGIPDQWLSYRFGYIQRGA
jgi:hypothetical protein